jgi:hypothetical protein
MIVFTRWDEALAEQEPTPPPAQWFQPWAVRRISELELNNKIDARRNRVNCNRSKNKAANKARRKSRK